jgi:hypothetical protein
MSMTMVQSADSVRASDAPASTLGAPIPVAARWYLGNRSSGLARFAIAITILNIAGHLFLGFEQSWITPLIALLAAYTTEIVGETAEAWSQRRVPRYVGSVGDLIRFLLSAHITGLAVGMLLYACEQVLAIAFAASVAIASKYVLRVTMDAGRKGETVRRHFLNPSNFGITVTLLLFPTVGIAPPYQFTENTFGFVDWLLPLVVICTGTLLNSKSTGRIPLILAWMAAFVLQASVRSAIHGTPWQAGLAPVTGFAFILFTFYMITDPATSPVRARYQVIFGCAVAFFYAVCVELHVVFGLFYALTIVTALRGLGLAVQSAWGRRQREIAGASGLLPRLGMANLSGSAGAATIGIERATSARQRL